MPRILINKHHASGATGATDELRREITRAGGEIELAAGGGFVLDVAEDEARRLDEAGFRMAELPAPNILRVGETTIDINAEPPAAADNLTVSAADAPDWSHRLVQLVAPPTPEWVADLQHLGVQVVEPLGPYGLFVLADEAQAAQLAQRPYVAWTGLFEPAYRIQASLSGARGPLEYIAINVVPPEDVDAVRDRLESLGARVRTVESPPPTNPLDAATISCDLDADILPSVAAIPSVRWIEPQGPDTLFDERSTQIVAESLNGAAAPDTAPVTGYQATLTTLGLSGAGVRIGICDSGVDNHNNATMHADLSGRLDFFVDATGGAVPTDTNGHGTHVAGIAAGNAALGNADPQGFLLGQGVAPGARIGSVNQINPGGTLTDGQRVQQMVANNAHVMNNSWGQSGTGPGGGAPGMGYIARSRTFDQLVRDPDAGTAELERLAIVSAAGNDGTAGLTSVGAPWEAKNPIVVGNSRTFRPGEGSAVDDIRGISDSSGRGPAVDGRILPTVVAPGSDIVSARSTVDTDPATAGVQRPRVAYTDTGAVAHQDYTRLSGTSMATPYVAGLCALLIEWWRDRTGGRTPSTALLKAFLVNGAEDLAGGPDGAGGTLANVPGPAQGWGRVSLENMVLQAPGSDRGPRIFSDQRHAFTASGQEFTLRVAVAEPTRQLRVTLVYSDAPGAAGANPALVNNLNLEVEETATTTMFRGNVFANGFSVAGGAFDNVDNIECVYVQNPTGVYEVRVVATSVVANARPPFDVVPWQDFALVIENAEAADADPAKVALVLDRSGSMVGFGYVDATRQASKQFVDLLRTDDRIGVVSFGDSGLVEFPTAPPAVLQTVTGAATRAAARAEVDDISFGGCTFMGEGIQRGHDLLAPETGARSIVLFSDGYDNKGCDPLNPARPSALDAAGALPAGLPIHSCAMGPAADQALLEQLATSTSGRYYFMPTIDDLFEIYNFIRGQASSDGVIVNDTTTASASRVAGFVESLAERATFTCAWRETDLKFTTAKPKRGQIAVRLRDPRGKLVRHDAAFVRTFVGAGYAVFDIPDPAPGLWHVEVETAGDTHTRYTVGGFVESPIIIHAKVGSRVRPGSPIEVSVDSGKPVSRLSATAVVTAPVMGLPTVRTKFEKELADIRPVKFTEDVPPGDIPKLLALHALLLDRGTDIFARRARRLGLSGDPGAPLTGRFHTTGEEGSYNARITVSGLAGRSRFVRQELLSVCVG